MADQKLMRLVTLARTLATVSEERREELFGKLSEEDAALMRRVLGDNPGVLEGTIRRVAGLEPITGVED